MQKDVDLLNSGKFAFQVDVKLRYANIRWLHDYAVPETFVTFNWNMKLRQVVLSNKG